MHKMILFRYPEVYNFVTLLFVPTKEFNDKKRIPRTTSDPGYPFENGYGIYYYALWAELFPKAIYLKQDYFFG